MIKQCLWMSCVGIALIACGGESNNPNNVGGGAGSPNKDAAVGTGGAAGHSSGTGGLGGTTVSSQQGGAGRDGGTTGTGEAGTGGKGTAGAGGLGVADAGVDSGNPGSKDAGLTDANSTDANPADATAGDAGLTTQIRTVCKQLTQLPCLNGSPDVDACVTAFEAEVVDSAQYGCDDEYYRLTVCNAANPATCSGDQFSNAAACDPQLLEYQTCRSTMGCKATASTATLCSVECGRFGATCTPGDVAPWECTCRNGKLLQLSECSSLVYAAGTCSVP